MKLRNPKYKVLYSDKTARKDNWRWGVLFYGLALSLSATSIFMYYVPYRKYLTTTDYTINNTQDQRFAKYQSVRDDMNF